VLFKELWAVLEQGDQLTELGRCPELAFTDVNNTLWLRVVFTGQYLTQCCFSGLRIYSQKIFVNGLYISRRI
jgi:hypothetical protein